MEREGFQELRVDLMIYIKYEQVFHAGNYNENNIRNKAPILIKTRLIKKQSFLSSPF